MYQLVIKNGMVLDGSGKDAFAADVAVENGKIVKVAPGIEGGEKVIDATGLVVTPGFVDSHSHSDAAIIKFPEQVEKAEQGITTTIAGQCGDSLAPAIDEETGKLETMGQYLAKVREIPQGSNIAVLVGHSALRKSTMGLENREPTEQELNKMKELLAEGIQNGAPGLSFGLVYTPSCYSKTPELIELAKVAAENGGIVAAHLRNEGDTVIEAVEEFITVIKASGARGVISHHKAMKKENWGKVNKTIALVDQANAEGCDIYFDVYPYNASSTSLSSRLVPKEYRTGGPEGIVKVLSDPELRKKIKEEDKKLWGEDLSWMLIVECPGHPEYEGMNLSEIGKLRGQDDYDAGFDLLRDSPKCCNACFFAMCEEDIHTVMAHPRTMIGTDGNVAAGRAIYHPRVGGTFTRTLGRYVREAKVTTLPEMIRKMTTLPAEVYGLKNKGWIKEGYDADICIFDPDKIIDRCDYVACHERAEGLNYVIVNGQVVAENAVHTMARPGKVLLKGKEML